MEEKIINAEVISVFPDKVKIAINDLENFQIAEDKLKVGSYIRIADNDNSVLIAIIENFSIEIKSNESSNTTKRIYIIEAIPLGMLIEGKFERGGDTLTIPPKSVEPAKKDDINGIYDNSIDENKKFIFSRLSSNNDILVPIDGNKFFGKHIAIVGSTGSGKSHTVAKIIQNAINCKKDKYRGLNNSHIIIFDIHSEYKSAFKDANLINIDNLILPYWLLNGDELEELFLDTGDNNNYNQSSVLRNLITINKQKLNNNQETVDFDSPVKFDINEIYNALCNLKKETHEYTNDLNTTYKGEVKTFKNYYEKYSDFFKEIHEFAPTANGKIKRGPYSDGTIDKFINRFYNKINDKRLNFLFGEKSKNISFEDVIKQFIGYLDENKTNVTIIDLSGVPFEVLSITVSLISRMLFEYGYYYKRLRCKENENENEIINNDVPILLVYEEAHKYVPKSDLAKYKSSKQSIERIAKEGRKYGVTLLLASQRPSELSETIFSQCNNFIAMRLTNPNDQGYVKKLLPDTLGNLVDKMPNLKTGEALLIGDSITLPSIVQIDECDKKPSSNDIPYLELWKEEWKELDINKIRKEWCNH